MGFLGPEDYIAEELNLNEMAALIFKLTGKLQPASRVSLPLVICVVDSHS